MRSAGAWETAAMPATLALADVRVGNICNSETWQCGLGGNKAAQAFDTAVRPKLFRNQESLERRLT